MRVFQLASFLVATDAYNACIMDATQLTSQLQQALQLIEELRSQNASLTQAVDQLGVTKSLSQELQTLRCDYEALVHSTQTLMEDRDRLQQRVEELEVTNRRLVDMLWGRRSEVRRPAPGQLQLDFPDDTPSSEQEQAVIMAQQQVDEAADLELLRVDAERRRRRRAEQRANREFPKNLERRERVLDLDEEQKEGLTYIGDEVTERLRFEKPHVYVERIVRRKYVAKKAPEQGVITAPTPLNIVEGSRYDFSVIAAILSQKYAFHCPTYRQQDWFAQCGWHPSRSTINDLINTSVSVLVPLFWQMWSLLLDQDILMTDDTRVQLLSRNALNEEQQELLRKRRTSGTPPGSEPGNVLDPGSVTSYAWLYRGLDGLAPYNVFHWSLSHEHAVVDAHLENYRGVLVGDGYSAYTQIAQRSDSRIVHASCNVHARREFLSAEGVEPILSAQAKSLYRQLYDVEERGTHYDAQRLYELRQREAVPIWNRFERWLESEPLRRVLPESPIGKAVTYVRNQWADLQRYLSDGRIPIDNSLTEQDLRPLTVGRANWKFLGHPQAAEGRLQLISITSSAARHHLVMHDYLEDVLRKLADAAQHHPQHLEIGGEYLLDLLPDRWATMHPQSVRQERIEEKKRVDENKRARRARRRLLERRRAQDQN